MKPNHPSPIPGKQSVNRAEQIAARKAHKLKLKEMFPVTIDLLLDQIIATYQKQLDGIYAALDKSHTDKQLSIHKGAYGTAKMQLEAIERELERLRVMVQNFEKEIEMQGKQYQKRVEAFAERKKKEAGTKK